jgi:predicted PurR-regulated permease PerM
LETEDLKKQVLQLALTLGRRALIFWFVGAVLAILGLIIWLLQEVHLVAKLTAVSVLLSYIIAPGVNFLSDRRGMNRIAAISIVYAALALILAVVLAYVIPALQGQLTGFVAHFAEYVENLQVNLDNLLVQVQKNAPAFLQEPLSRIKPDQIQLSVLAKEVQGSAPAWLGSTFVGVFTGVKAAAGALTGAVLIPLFTFYILMDSRKYTEGFVRLFPTRWKKDVQELINEIDSVLGSYIRGQLLVCFTIGTSIAILLSVMGVPYAILIGVFAGVVDIIPYVGVALGMIPAFLIALGHKGILFAIFVVIMMEVVHWSEGHIIVPAIIGHSVGLPPLVVMIALGAGAELGGVMGMFLAMPLAAILRVLTLFYVRKLENYEAGLERSPLVEPDRAEPAADLPAIPTTASEEPPVGPPVEPA